MKYEIKSIPTTYAGVNFRSRLEARWAAFFDLCGWKWDYEPFDLDGWAPDFLIKGMAYPVLVEVKPFDLGLRITDEVSAAFEKAVAHRGEDRVVLLLGIGPVEDGIVGSIIYEQATIANIYWELNAWNNHESIWREAGNLVQWKRDEQPSAVEIVRRAVNKVRIAA